VKSISERFEVAGRVAVVTGASSGLGVTFAEALAEAGARLVLAARRRDRLETLQSRLIAAGSEVEVVECDVTRTADVGALADATLARFGRADILVNNAGVAHTAPATEETVEEFSRTLQVNVVGAYACAQRFGRIMLEQGSGSIINVASMLGVVASGLIPQAAYVSSKGAVVQMTRELAAQWARRGVRVNAIAPGFFPSEMTGSMLEDENGQRYVRRRTPLGRAGIPEELVGPLLLLASDASSYMIGQILVVDGGWTII
jgi:NAD(P)-dependent dehydrogenase (short-subunit alcohol dehydrogenase family)